MNKREARERREALETEIQAAAIEKDSANREAGAARDNVEQVTAERKQRLSEAARGMAGAVERSHDLGAAIAASERTAREAVERREAADRGQADARTELNAHLVEHLHVFAAEADRLADKADESRARALAAVQEALVTDQAARSAWAELSKATRDRRTAGMSLGDQPRLVLGEVFAQLKTAQRPEPANAGEARRPGLLKRVFTRYRNPATGEELDRVRRGSPEEAALISANNATPWAEVR